jgi:hypothetical protein
MGSDETSIPFPVGRDSAHPCPNNNPGKTAFRQSLIVALL